MSGETSGKPIDVGAITRSRAGEQPASSTLTAAGNVEKNNPAKADVGEKPVEDTSGVEHAEALLEFAEHAVNHEQKELAASRDRLRALLGDEGVVDTAAIVGNFERMTRIADGTGIPLDGPVNALSAELQQELGLREFRSSGATQTPGALIAGLAARARPYVFRVLGAITRMAPPKR